MGRLVGLLTLLLAIARSTVAQPADDLAPFRRCVMIPHWLTGRQWLQVTPADLVQLKAVGFTCVRLPIDPAEQFGPQEPYTRHVDQALKAILDSGLAAILVMMNFADSDWQQRLATVPGAIDTFAADWHFLAARYRSAPPARLAFEILNEPRPVLSAERWNSMQARLHRAIRSAVPEHIIIATGTRWSHPDSLRSVRPIADAHTVYAFHFYEFPVFALQGMTWAGPGIRDAHAIPYPDPALGYTRQHMEAILDDVTAWARRQGIRLIVTEMGATQRAPPQGIARYLADLRQALEARGLGWTVWAYAGPEAGLFTGPPGRRQPVDGEELRALGLEQATRRWRQSLRGGRERL